MKLICAQVLRYIAPLLLTAATFHASAAPGDLDPTFTSSKPLGCSDSAYLFAGADGSFYLSCRTATAVTVTKYSGRGTIDTRWGENGIARYQMPACPTGTCYGPYGTEDYDGGVRLILPDGRSIRYRVDGKTDLGYGREVTDVAGLLGDNIIEPGSPATFAIQADGGLLVLSTIPLPRTSNYSIDFETLILRRLLPNGRRDLAFGNSGELRYRFPFSRGNNNGFGFSRNMMPITSGELVAWSLQPDKRLEVLFTTLPNIGALQRPLQAVTLVASALEPTPTGRSFPAAGVGGWMDSEQRVLPDGSQLFSRYQVTRWRPNGVLDLDFGNTGRGAVSVGNCPTSPSLSLLAGGGIATYSSNATGIAHLCGPGVTYIAAFTAAGSLSGNVGHVNSSSVVIDRAGKLITVLHNGTGNLIRVQGQGTRAEVPVIEYYHPLLDHYFMTATEQEIEVLDNNPAWGWRRTGHRFGAWNIDTPLTGAESVCRYYGDLTAGPNSHFYSAEKFECDILATLEAASPIGTRAWRFERDAFRITVPVNGKCPDALWPVYRVYNGGSGVDYDPNHRYLTNTTEYQAMLAKGWADEGVHMCATPNG